MSLSLHLAVRTVHVLAMALLVGGAVGCWIAARRSLDDLHALATGYEWAFWAGLGVLVLTGVGNLGALGAPGPATRWGRVLLLKLALVLLFVLGSAVRTLAVARTRRSMSLAAWSERAYGLTTLSLLALVVLAEVLAHG
jgi:hypothetical protein